MPEGVEIPAAGAEKSMVVTPTKISDGDPLTKLLDASALLHDSFSASIEDSDFLKKYRDVWQKSPECTSLGLEEGANTLLLCRRHHDLHEVLLKEELSDMGVGLLRLLNSPDWNRSSIQDILQVTGKLKSVLHNLQIRR